MNKVFLIGNLTRDPESNTTASGVSFCRFSIAVNRRFARDNAENVDYFNVVTWRGVADACAKVLTKGRKVAVTGSIQMRNYEGNDGVRRQAVDIVADDVEFLSSPMGQGGSDTVREAPSQREQPAVKELTPIDDDELPF